MSAPQIIFRRARKGWVGFDFDGTLSKYDGYGKPLGDPIPLMVEELRGHLLRGQECRIVTARATSRSDVFLIEKWCQEHVGHDPRSHGQEGLRDVEALRRQGGLRREEHGQDPGGVGVMTERREKVYAKHGVAIFVVTTDPCLCTERCRCYQPKPRVELVVDKDAVLFTNDAAEVGAELVRASARVR